MADNQVWAIAPTLGGRVPLDALSDGYTVTLAWTIDLIARWARWAELLERKPPEGNFFERMQGLVLIDELDLHLHPSWQRTIVTTLRNLFPRLSFIATTHNPLTLFGTEPGEVFVVRTAAESESRVEAKRFDVPRGLRADRILTGEWFGLPYAVDDDTAALVEAHQRMLLSGVSEDAPERKRLEDELAQRFGSYADSSIDLAAKQVAAELKREMAPSTPAERSELRQRLRERVRERLRGPRQS